MYTILTDSCSDLNAQIAARFTQLEVLPLSYTISGQTSTQPFDDAARCSAFYDRLRAGETCTTSQVSPGDFAEAFKAHAKKGEAVLGLIFSSALSGTYASACMARDMVLEEYPDAVIELVDTLSASAGEGMVVYDALLRRDAGMPSKKMPFIQKHICRNTPTGLRWMISTFSSAAAGAHRRRLFSVRCLKSSRCCMWTAKDD